MADLGSISLLISLVLVAYSAFGSLTGVLIKADRLILSARYAVYLVPLSLLFSTIGLIGAFVTKDFQVQYVWAHSNRAMDPQYIWVAFYAGNEGSLLYIAMSMSIFAAVAIYFSPRAVQPSLPHITLVLMAVLAFFVAVTAFLANPFERHGFLPADGQGMNPLLTHPGMFIHPPLLMAGLTAVTVPFGFVLGSLISGRTKDEWVDAGRFWGIVAWVVLGIGILLGAWWAYTILGWGGYWAWDPVENASFMPWLVITAFIHSIMVQKRRGMFRMWNLALVIIAFGFAQFGMFINRGGPVPSVHSFGQSTLGWVFLMFMGVTMLLSFLVFAARYNSLKSDQFLESSISREAAFLFNNMLFVLIAFVTLWGVVYPLISELFQGEIVTVGAPFYDQVNGPLFLGLIFLMAVAPFLPWRRASWLNLRRAIQVQVVVGIASGAILMLVGVEPVFAILSFSICSMVVVGILREWVRGTHSRHKRGENYLLAFVKLISADRPRYGGYVVHLAVVVLALGITGSSFFEIQKDVSLAPGESAEVGAYTIQYISSSFEEKTDRTEGLAEVRVSRDGNFLGTYYPRRDFYPSFNMASTQAAIRSTPVEDLYIVPGEFLDDGRAIFRVMVNPMVWWMWLAGPIMILGTLIALWPQRLVSERVLLTREGVPDHSVV